MTQLRMVACMAALMHLFGCSSDVATPVTEIVLSCPLVVPHAEESPAAGGARKTIDLELDGISLYLDKPQDNARQIPEEAPGEAGERTGWLWQLDAGENHSPGYWLECRYGSGKATVPIRVPETAKACTAIRVAAGGDAERWSNQVKCTQTAR